MKKTLDELYKIEMLSIIRKSNNVYQINTKNGKYILKYVSQTLENIYHRLSLCNDSYFNIPILSKNNKYVEFFNNKYFTISHYYEDEFILTKDVRLSFFMKAIADLHIKSKYPIKLQDGYFNESLTYLQDQIDKIEHEIITRISRIEKETYHSPADWYFLLNYPHFISSIKEASIHLDRFEEEYKKEKDLNLCLTYQNFDFSHILIKSSKIISLEKMILAPSIFDLYNVIINLRSDTLSLIPYIKEYLEINKLKQFEFEWLFTLLFIPSFERKNNEIDEIESLMDTLKYIKISEELASTFYTNEQ